MRIRYIMALAVLGAVACSSGPRAVRQQQRQQAEKQLQDESEEEPYQVSASHILIGYKGAERADESVTRSPDEARALAQEVLGRVQAGEDFVKLARELSDGPSAAAGGSLGSFTRSQMVEAFSDAAFSIEPGQVYDEVVETQFGFHVIRRDK